MREPSFHKKFQSNRSIARPDTDQDRSSEPHSAIQSHFADLVEQPDTHLVTSRQLVVVIDLRAVNSQQASNLQVASIHLEADLRRVVQDLGNPSQ